MGEDFVLNNNSPIQIKLVLGISQNVNSSVRSRLYSFGVEKVFSPLIHTSAWVATDMKFSDEIQILSGGIV